MTEELARTKWCPMTRFSGDSGGTTFNRGSRDHMNNPEIDDRWIPRCIASDCMMWRAKLDSHATACAGCIYRTLSSSTHCDACDDLYSGWTSESSLNTDYCGLAGKL